MKPSAIAPLKMLGSWRGRTMAVVCSQAHECSDGVFLSRAWGGVLFMAVMFVIFQSVFTWALPLMDATESIMPLSAKLFRALPTVHENFVSDACLAALGRLWCSFRKFLFSFIIGMLEDRILVKVAIICHRPLRYFGLSGKSLFLSNGACLRVGHLCRAHDQSSACAGSRADDSAHLLFARLPIYSLFIVARFHGRQSFSAYLV